MSSKFGYYFTQGEKESSYLCGCIILKMKFMSTSELKTQSMIRVVLDIKTSKYPFFLELVEHFDFIKLEHETAVDATAPKMKSAPRNVSRFKSVLTADEAGRYHQYLQSARQEWDRHI
jgi:hypothetical protein